MPNVPPPSSGLGSNSNYFLTNNGQNISGVGATIDVSTDINASDGFGFQFTAYSPDSETCAVQQYAIVVDTSGQMTCIVNNWQNANTALINNWVSLYKLPNGTLPAGYQCGIALQNDQSGNIAAATYTVIALGVAPARGSALDSYWGSDSSQHVNFIGTDGHVHELYIHPNANWANNDLSQFAGGVLPEPGAALDAYWGSDNSQHVNFIGTDGHIHELYIHPGANWVNNDLSQFAGGVLPAPGTKLHAYWGSDKSQHVNFIGTDGHIHELYIHPGANWVNNDLNQFAGGVLPEPGTALDAYWGSDNSQHVNFIGVDGHVHELYIHPGADWVNNDLTNVLLASVTQTLSEISGVSSIDLSPIVAFELDFVGYENGQSTTVSSGSGTITYTAANAMTVVNAEPSYCEFDGGTSETANTAYGELPTGSSVTFVQTFDTAAETIKASKRNGLMKRRPSPTA